MCGRYTITADAHQLALRFGAEPTAAGVAARYNAAPTQQLPVIVGAEPTAIQLLTWGLVPAWARDKTGGTRLINARLETAAVRPSFRDAWRQRRCLVLADGFYEWQRTARGKVPMRITLKSNEPFAFAGLWEEWRGADDEARSAQSAGNRWGRPDTSDGPALRTFTILTTTPNDLMAPIHKRMPVILRPEQEAAWLNTESDRDWQRVLGPFPSGPMTAYPVSSRVNSPRYDDPSLIEPLAATERPLPLGL